MKNYGYLSGLAELSQSIDSAKVEVYMEDHPNGDHCDYCGAHLRYKNFFDDGKTCIGIGSCCAEHVFRYMNLPPEMVTKAITFFKKYQELALRAKTDPVARLDLKNLDKAIADLRAKIEAQKADLALAHKDEINELLNTGNTSDWERSFLADCRVMMTPKMEKLFNRVKEDIKGRGTNDDLKKIQTKLSYLFLEGKGKIYEPIYNIFSDMHNRQLNTFSPKQTALIEKYHLQLAQSQPKDWNLFVNCQVPLRLREDLKLKETT